MPAADLDTLIPIAREAAARIQAIADTDDLGKREKDAGAGPVTEADLAADRYLREELAKAFPGDVLISEETWEEGSRVSAASRIWFIDPLDGTRELINRTGDYSVMIGLAVDGEPELGLVCQPTNGKLWGGCVSEQVCFSEHEGRRVERSVKERTAKGQMRMAVSRSHKGALAKIAEEELGATAIEKGSVGLKVGLIVDDEADLYLSGSRRMKVWDTCGPAAILRAAGGLIEAVDGSPLTYHGDATHRKGLRAFPPAVATSWRPTIDDAVARWRARKG